MLANITTLGLIAGSLTALCTIPQIFKIWTRKCAKDISYPMYFVLSLGVALWIFYGIEKKDFAIVLTNSFSLLLNLTIIGMKLAFGTKSQGDASPVSDASPF